LGRHEEIEFDAWLEADERHARAFAEVSCSSRMFDRLAVACPDSTEAGRAAIASGQRRWRAVLVPSLVAAALAIGCFAWWRPTHRTHYSETAVSEIGALRTLSLPDGSGIQLNTDSSVEVAFTATERRVQLVRGEAYFRIAKDPARPFIVATERVNVRAVGTAFNVRLALAAVDVLVTEGAVRVDDPVKGESFLNRPAPLSPAVESPAPVLTAGQRVVIPTHIDGQIAPVVVATMAPEEAERALAWKEKRLVFVSEPLAEVVAQFNRHNRHKLVILDPRLNELRFGGRFRPDGYDGFVQLLESHFGISAERRVSETLLRQSP
jgi:transmembrane sensor